MEKRKKELIEDLGVLLERDNIAPLAARIFATLILTGKEGITFDRLVIDLKASKSTISTHLDHLQKSNKVRYFTKSGDRKRYFIINPDLLINDIDEMTTKWEQQKLIHQRVYDYKKEYNTTREEQLNFDLEFQQDLLTYLEEASGALQKFKVKIQQKHLTNHNS